LLPILIDELRDLIPTSSCTFVHINNRYQVDNIYDDSPDISRYGGEYGPIFFPRLGRQYHPNWCHWLREKNDTATHDEFVFPKFYETDYYHEFLSPLQKHDSLITPIKTDINNPHGVLVMSRAKGDTAFSEREVNALNTLNPYIAACFSHSEPENLTRIDSGLMIFDTSAKLVHSTTDARVLMFQAALGFNYELDTKYSALPKQLTDFVDKYIRMYRNGGMAQISILKIRTRWQSVECKIRWLSSHQSRDDSYVVVSFQRLVPRNYAIWKNNQPYGFTQRQWMVIFRLIDGKTQEQVAHSLNIGYGTVADHMKEIYRKAGVNNRVDLITALLSQKDNINLSE